MAISVRAHTDISASSPKCYYMHKEKQKSTEIILNRVSLLFTIYAYLFINVLSKRSVTKFNRLQDTDKELARFTF